MRKLEKNLKALANKRRLSILQYLKRKESASVGELANHLKISFKATSKHLVVLSAQNILEREQVGAEMIYTLAEPLDSEIEYIIKLL